MMPFLSLAHIIMSHFSLFIVTLLLQVPLIVASYFEIQILTFCKNYKVAEVTSIFLTFLKIYCCFSAKGVYGLWYFIFVGLWGQNVVKMRLPWAFLLFFISNLIFLNIPLSNLIYLTNIIKWPLSVSQITTLGLEQANKQYFKVDLQVRLILKIASLKLPI